MRLHRIAHARFSGVVPIAFYLGPGGPLLALVFSPARGWVPSAGFNLI
jgi:hypothetical protein